MKFANCKSPRKLNNFGVIEIVARRKLESFTSKKTLQIVNLQESWIANCFVQVVSLRIEAREPRDSISYSEWHGKLWQYSNWEAVKIWRVPRCRKTRLGHELVSALSVFNIVLDA